MGKDYYGILQIDRIANEVDVSKAFRKLSLKWHPKLSKEDQHTTYAHFCDIAEAFEVLSDPIKRAMYDKYGEEKLKDGFFSDGGFKGGYRFGGKPEEIFEQFFGSNNPFEQICDLGNEELGSMFGFAFGGQNYRHADRIPNLEVPVDCTLNELYNGCSKVVTFKRQALNPDGRTTREAVEKKEIEIKRGSNSSTSIIFEGMGNEAAGVPTSDLVFKLKELPHSNFKRKGDDLVYTAKITLLHALMGEPLNIMTLDSRKLHVSVDEIINPKTVKRVEGEGMPLSHEAGAKRGDLFIKFDISFPKEISPEHKELLKEVLQQ